MKRILPPFARYALSMSISAGKKSVFGPATTSTDASAGTCFSCASTSVSAAKVVGRRAPPRSCCSRSGRCASVLCSPWPWTKYTFCCFPCTTLIRPLVSSCSPSEVTRSVRPSYSNTTVPAAVILYWFASAGRSLDVDVLDLQLLREVLVLVEALAKPRRTVGPVEHADLHRLLQALQHLLRLIRQRELLGGRQVPPLVVPRRRGS